MPNLASKCKNYSTYQLFISNTLTLGLYGESKKGSPKEAGVYRLVPVDKKSLGMGAGPKENEDGSLVGLTNACVS